MIQIYGTDERDFINEYRDFKDDELTLISAYIQNLLKRKETNKIVIKKFK